MMKNKTEKVAEALANIQQPRPFVNQVLTKCPDLCVLLLAIAEGTRYKRDAEIAVKEIYPAWPEINE